MHPGAPRPRQRDQFGERVERPAADISRLQANHHRPLESRQHRGQRIRPHPPLGVRRRHMHPLAPRTRAAAGSDCTDECTSPPSTTCTSGAPKSPLASTSQPAPRSSAFRAAASAVKFAIVAPVREPDARRLRQSEKLEHPPGRHLLRRRRRRRRIGERRVLPPGRSQPVRRHPRRMRRPDHPAMEVRRWSCRAARPPPRRTSSSTTAPAASPRSGTGPPKAASISP